MKNYLKYFIGVILTYLLLIIIGIGIYILKYIDAQILFSLMILFSFSAFVTIYYIFIGEFNKIQNYYKFIFNEKDKQIEILEDENKYFLKNNKKLEKETIETQQKIKDITSEISSLKRKKLKYITHNTALKNKYKGLIGKTKKLIKKFKVLNQKYFYISGNVKKLEKSIGVYKNKLRQNQEDFKLTIFQKNEVIESFKQKIRNLEEKIRGFQNKSDILNQNMKQIDAPDGFYDLMINVVNESMISINKSTTYTRFLVKHSTLELRDISKLRTIETELDKANKLLTALIEITETSSTQVRNELINNITSII